MDELQLFLQDWRKELKEIKGDQSPPVTVPSEEERSDLTSAITVTVNGKRDRQELCVEDEEDQSLLLVQKRHHLDEATTEGTEGLALFVLPCGGERRERSHQHSPRRKHVNEGIIHQSSLERKSLVDTLIADLDEINTIPFFDIQIPREIALVIFSHLDTWDLCHCAMVSHNWRLLAEDDVLWCRICQKMGYDTDISDTYHITWKNVVRELVLRKRQVKRNWKERICGLFQHQPYQEGKLCCVAKNSHLILCCYSSGESYLWSLRATECEDGPGRLEQIPGHFEGAVPTCAIVNSHLGIVGTAKGCVKVFDLRKCQQVCTLSDFNGIKSLAMAASPYFHHIAVANASPYHPSHSRITVLGAPLGEPTFWERQTLDLPGPAQYRSFKVQQMDLVLSGSGSANNGCCVLYSTQTSLTLQSPGQPYSQALHILTATGQNQQVNCINCFCHNESSIACGTFDCNWYQVRLYDLCTGSHRVNLRGHAAIINCVQFDDSTESDGMRLVTGGQDKRVHVYDVRQPLPALQLIGHSDAVLSVQMDEWKVVSGSQDGNVIVWDQRMGQELWRTQERHPVQLCQFEDNYLTVSHIPSVIALSSPSDSPDTLHRRQLGMVRVFDFSVDQLHYTQRLPSICSSAYDEPSASFYNLDLIVPYDTLP